MATSTDRIQVIFQDARELQADALELLAWARSGTPPRRLGERPSAPPSGVSDHLQEQNAPAMAILGHLRPTVKTHCWQTGPHINPAAWPYPYSKTVWDMRT